MCHLPKHMNISMVAVTAAPLSEAKLLVVSGAFLPPQPCNFVVWEVIISSLFIVIVLLAL